MKISLHGFWDHRPNVFLTIETMSIYFLFGLLTLLDLLRLVVSFAQGQAVMNWDTGYGFIIITRPWGYYGLIIIHDDRYWLGHITAHYGKFHWYSSQPGWSALLVVCADGWGPGCYLKQISCPGWCLHSCRYLFTLYSSFLDIYPFFIQKHLLVFQPLINGMSQPWKGLFFGRPAALLTVWAGAWEAPWQVYHAWCTAVWSVVRPWLLHCWLEAWLLGGWSSAVYSAVTHQGLFLLKKTDSS